MRPPHRILLVRLSHLGDVVHTLPIYHALRAAHPRAEVAWAVQPEFAELVRLLPGLSRTICFERRIGLAAWPALRDELLSYRADWAIDAQGNSKSALVTLLSGAERRSGWDRRDWTERFGAHVLTDPAPPLARGTRHAVERALHLARHVAAEGLAAIPRESIAPREEDLVRARARAAEAFPDGADGARVVLHLAAPGDVRSWSAGHFGALARRLARRGARVLTISGPAEARVGAELERALHGEPNVTHWVGQRGLGELAACFSAVRDRGARLVSCESGPLHLAAACGLPVLALAGPQDPRRTGPWPAPGAGSPHGVLSARHGPPCAPCRARRCAHEGGPVCMTRIAPEDVERALLGPNGAPEAPHDRRAAPVARAVGTERARPLGAPDPAQAARSEAGVERLVS